MPFEDYKLTHRGRVMHICVSKQTTIGLDNGLAPGRRQVIIWTNARILLIGPLETNFQWNLNKNSNIFIQENAFENIVCEMTLILSQPQCNINSLDPGRCESNISVIMLGISCDLSSGECLP